MVFRNESLLAVRRTGGEEEEREGEGEKRWLEEIELGAKKGLLGRMEREGEEGVSL